MLKPLKLILSDSIFENPANGKYSQIVSEKTKVFLLNDFRWSKDLFTWHDMLLLLEDKTVKLPGPKNIYREDNMISTHVAIFSTSKSSVKHRGTYSASGDREKEITAARWKNYKFRHQFFSQEQKNLPLYSRYFAKLVVFD